MSASFKNGVAALRAFASGNIKPEDVRKFAASLRETKHRDPVLGVISAYLYRAVADFDNIRRMAFYYTLNSQPVPFDIVLLGEMKVRRKADGGFTVFVPSVEAGDQDAARGLPTYAFEATPAATGAVGGWCPWLGVGWDFVGEPREEWAVLVEGLPELAGTVERRGFTWFPEEQGRMLARRWGLTLATRHDG
jgi:hypothetical protein